MFVALGTSTIDLFVEGVEHLPRATGEHFQVGNLIFCERPARLSLGGNGANSALVLARLGAPVRLASAIGDDLAGALVAQWLDAAGVDLRWLSRRSDVATSTSSLIVDQSGGRLIFLHPGAYETMRAGDLPAGWTEGVHTLLIGGYSPLHRLRWEGCFSLLAEAKRAGVRTAVDIGPAIGDFPRLDEVTRLLPVVDYVIANEHELCACTGIEAWETAANAMLQAGAANLVIKRGEEGASLLREGAQFAAPAMTTTVQQTVGAGDTFNAAFLFALDAGYDAEGALRFGCATAAQIVASPRGMLDAPTRATVEAVLEQGARGAGDADLRNASDRATENVRSA